MITLGDFRKATQHLPDNTPLIVEPDIVVETVEAAALRAPSLVTMIVTIRLQIRDAIVVERAIFDATQSDLYALLMSRTGKPRLALLRAVSPG